MITDLDLFVAFETDIASSVAVSFEVFIFHIFNCMHSMPYSLW